MFDYPFEKPEKVTSFTLDKKPEFTGNLPESKDSILDLKVEILSM
jgi:hypothetical protein